MLRLRAPLVFPLVLCLAGAAARPFAAPSVYARIGTDPFALLAASSGAAVSLQNSRSAAGTRAILAEYLRGTRADQLLALRPSGSSGSFALSVGETGRVLELREAAAGEYLVVLADPTGSDGQRWRIEESSPGLYRVVSRLAGLELAAGTRSALTALPAGPSVAQLWRISLEPVALLDPASAARYRPGEGRLAERSPSLARQLRANRESWIDPLLASRRLEEYWARAGPEIVEGLDLLLLERVYALAPDDRNYALTLLLWMLSQGAYEAGDSVTVALALANASLYAEGDEEVRAAIRVDLLEHYRLYRAVLRWQEGWALGSRLSEAPFFAKLLWCYRSNQVERNGAALTLQEYRAFVDRIDVLGEMHRWVAGREVSEAPSLRGVVENVNSLFQGSYRYAHFLAMIRQWYVPQLQLPEKAGDDELYAALSRPEVASLLPEWAREVLADYRNGTYYVEVGGRRRDPQARMWLNYQWKLRGETGFFRGDCGTEAEVSMALLKAAGIPAMAVYHTGEGIGHAYAAYYDPLLRRFLTLQDFGGMEERYGPDTEVSFRPMPLRLHDRLRLREPTASSSVRSYVRFVARGIAIEPLARLYLDASSASRPGELFTASACRAARPDADGDGLADEDETVLGTDPGAADSDGDGFSDRWELERRFDPRDRAAPDAAGLWRVLVGHQVEAISALSGRPLAGRGAWRIVRTAEPQQLELVSPASGRCLGVGEGGRVAEEARTGFPAQRWRLVYRGAGQFLIQASSGEVMVAGAGGSLGVKPSTGAREELWILR